MMIYIEDILSYRMVVREFLSVKDRRLFFTLGLDSVKGWVATSGLLSGDVKESRNGNPTRDLQMATDRTRIHILCGL